MPKARATGRRTKAAGQALGSMSPPLSRLKSDRLTGRASGRVSSRGKVKATLAMPSRADATNIHSMPHSTVSQLPSAGPVAMPALPATPR